ncbi:hypothetical protein [Pedobacter arcticus]|uniref:hypothetical protein n=1 Tax=Pedobacter arcticus TaxID=752140 RepID=UPI00031C6E5C|nr:hypothetical protein [Pedobacter arcticus]
MNSTYIALNECFYFAYDRVESNTYYNFVGYLEIPIEVLKTMTPGAVRDFFNRSDFYSM